MTAWTMTAPVISTGHLTQDVCEAACSAVEFEGPGEAVCVPMPDGFLLRIIGEEDGLPQCLRDVFEWAITHKHEWVRFDSDGDTEDGPPTYDW